jgi:Polysaccharide deacetylase/N-acetylmuramoyl-L-alanine amidase
LKAAGMGMASILLVGCESQMPVPLTPSLEPTRTATKTPEPTPTPLPTVTPEPAPTSTPEPWVTAAEIESRIPAVQIPVIEYHYPGFSGAGVSMPVDVFAAQLDVLKESGYKTVVDEEMAEFLNNNGFLPAKTVGLRIDQGAAHFQEFESMMGAIQTKGFTAMVFICAGDDHPDEHWDKLADWVRQGAITIGSHSVTHSDFRQLSSDQAYGEAVASKQALESRLAQKGVVTNVISFSFPYDSVPDDLVFLKAAGYKFCIAGPLYNVKDNSAKPGQFLLPTLFPYVADKMMEIVKVNPNSNPRSILLLNGYTFDDLVCLNTTPLTVEEIEKVTGSDYLQLSWGEFKALPISPIQERSLVKPGGIIIHTDDQSGNNFENWTTDRTFNALQERATDSHFAVGLDGISQFLEMYPGFLVPSRAAPGFSSYISIEMCGRDYSCILDPTQDSDKRKSVETITQTTVDLVRKLMAQYGIGFEKVLGHFEATASGKSDPGERYMNEYFRPLLRAGMG